jgi:DNA-directed RNA polymerase specialized sigma24 family protein
MKLDKAILERLYYEYAPRMVAFARRMLGDGKIAEDLVQDVFIRLWEK